MIDTAINCQLLAGIAMLFAGSSHPCSGSEHILGRISSNFPQFENYLHGEIVGSFALFCLFLQKALKDKHLRFGIIFS